MGFSSIPGEEPRWAPQMLTADRIIGLLLIALAFFFFMASGSLPPAPVKGTPGPAYLPRLLSILLIASAAILILQTFRHPNRQLISWEPNSRARLLGVILLAVLVPIGMSYLGFFPTLFLSSWIFFQILRVPPVSAFFSAGGITFGIYLIFHWGLKVQFPPGMF